MKEQLHQIAQDLKAELQANSDFIYEHPELGFEEFQSSKAHVSLLTKHGFQVEYPYLGFDTAFRAIYDSGKPGPTIAYLSEYDALPGIGHGCGHNMLGTVNTGAGIALSKVLDHTGGKVIVLGTPAEETSGVKVDMAEADTFQGVDVAICSHPSDQNTQSGTSLAMEAIEFEFFGQTAHAAANPWMGRNALDAVIHLFNLINAGRQELRPDARVHGVIKEGGLAANVIPDYTRAQFYVRAADVAYMEEVKAFVLRCGQAAADAAACRMAWNHYEKGYKDMITNPSLSQAFNQNASDLGVEMLPAGDEFGSLDTGNVSHVVPAIHPYYEITQGKKVAGHTVEFREATRTPYAYEVMVRTVEILARTGYDVLTQPSLLESIQKDFQARYDK